MRSHTIDALACELATHVSYVKLPVSRSDLRGVSPLSCLDWSRIACTSAVPPMFRRKPRSWHRVLPQESYFVGSVLRSILVTAPIQSLCTIDIPQLQGSPASSFVMVRAVAKSADQRAPQDCCSYPSWHCQPLMLCHRKQCDKALNPKYMHRADRLADESPCRQN